METKGSSSGHAYWSGMEILGERQLLPRRRAACRVWPRRVSDTYQISKRKFDIVVELCWKCLKVFGFSGKLTSFTRQLFYFCDLFIFCSTVIQFCQVVLQQLQFKQYVLAYMAYLYLFFYCLVILIFLNYVCIFILFLPVLHFLTVSLMISSTQLLYQF